jgi:hypothetical protein
VILKRDGNLGRRVEEGLHFSAARLHDEGRKLLEKMKEEKFVVWNVGGESGRVEIKVYLLLSPILNSRKIIFLN